MYGTGTASPKTECPGRSDCSPRNLYYNYGTSLLGSNGSNQVLLNGANISTIGLRDYLYPLGITIVSGDPNAYDDDLQCDTISSESVAERNSVWSLHQYAAFPEESDMTGHQTHHYRPCPSSSMSMNSKSKMTASQKKEFCIAHDGTPAGDKCMVSGGSADCHACQMTVNGAIPGANVPITIVH